MTNRRVERPRPINERILILCEGRKTEPNYFKGIRQDKMHSRKLAALQIVVQDTMKNTAKELVAEAIALIKEAKQERNPYDSVWIIVDKDGYTKHPESFDRAKAYGIHICFSSPCFEYWILLHFEYTTAPFRNCEEVIDRLRLYIQGYEKAGHHYELLRNFMKIAADRGSKVIAHQKEVGIGQIWTHNPYTDVGILVGKLLTL